MRPPSRSVRADWAHPERAWGNTLELPVLRALWRAGSALTGQETHRVTGTGTYGGVRYALERLQRHGLVTGRTVGGSRLFSLNREHLLYPPRSRVRETRSAGRAPRARRTSGRAPLPGGGDLSVAVFGSVARGDAGLDSDLDLLVVVPQDDDPLIEALRRDARVLVGPPLEGLSVRP